MSRRGERCYQKDKAVENWWKKSHRCLEIQRFLNTDLTAGKDFQVICRNCDRSFQNAEKRFKEKEKQLSRSRALAQEKYTKIKTTRMLKFPEPPLKNKISLQPTFAETVLTELKDFPEKSEKFLVSRKQ